MKTSNKVSQIEKAGIYTLAKLEDFGIAEDDVKEFRANAIVEVTPELARLFLETNDYNRNISPRRVIAYTADILKGKWEINGETIKFDASGKLIDGQHRLSAIIRAGVTVPIEISFGLPYNSFTTIDTGKCRTAGDIVSIYGTKENSALIAGALKMLIDYELGREIGGNGQHLTNSRVNSSTTNTITNQMIQDAYVANEHIVDYIPTVKAIRTIGHRPLFTTLHYLFAKVDKYKADIFFENLYHGEYSIGEKLFRDNSIKLLRERLMNMYAHRERKGYNSNKTIAAMTIKVWNAFISGNEVKRIGKEGEVSQQRILDANGNQLKLAV